MRFLTPLYSPERKIGVFIYFAFIIIGIVIYNENHNSYLKELYNLILIITGILIPLIGFVGMRMAYYILFPSYILYIFFTFPPPIDDPGGAYFILLTVFTPLYYLLVTAVGFVLESIAQAYKFYKKE